MDEDTFSKALDYIERSGLKQARFLGGEPTLHPNFISFVKRSLERGLEIMVFSNGLMPDNVLNFLSSLPTDKLAVLLNTIHPEEGNPKGIAKQKKVMTRIGSSVIPGVNIYSRNFNLDHIVEYFEKFDLKREIRIGIAHTVLSENNRYLHPKDYLSIGSNIASFKSETERLGIRIGFDCGFVPCMFPSDSFELLKDELVKAGNCCHPLIDMLSDGTFISCYPLNNFLKIKLDDVITAKDIMQKFDAGLELYKDSGIFPYCSICPLFNSRCNGGCMAFRIRRFTSMT